MQCENRKMGWYFINYDELGRKISQESGTEAIPVLKGVSHEEGYSSR